MQVLCEPRLCVEFRMSNATHVYERKATTMRWILVFVMATLPVLASAQEASPLKTDKDKLSYAMGMDLAGQLKANAVDVDPTVFAKGMQDLLAGKTLLTDAEAKAIISELQKAMVTKQAAAVKAAGEKNKTEG